MPLYKICPSCGRRNGPEEMICADPGCLADLSRIKPVELSEEGDSGQVNSSSLPTFEEVKKAEGAHPDEKTIRESGKTVTLVIDGQEVIVRDGDVIGRHHKGREVLEKYRTVSRSHAQIFFEGENLYVIDLGSLNGTFVNGIEIPRNTKYPIHDGDRIHFSSRVEARVKFERRTPT